LKNNHFFFFVKFVFFFIPSKIWSFVLFEGYSFYCFSYLAGDEGMDIIFPNDFFLFFNNVVDRSGLFLSI